ncbi:MAG: bL35 family ribosomal protein [Candidatus Gracilibacteria bacterium]|jgi:ribosomal protein L35|nr:bL35 family ribosomal protein [Candidatus Gracilibacteria bacterium]
MKIKTKSCAKKRIKVRSSGSLKVDKACRRHLLQNKSKAQKALGKSGVKVPSTRLKEASRALPGKIKMAK